MSPSPLFFRSFAIGDSVRDQGAGVLAAFRLLSPGSTEYSDVPFTEIGKTISADYPVNIVHLECHGRNQGEELPGPVVKWGDNATEYAVSALAGQLAEAIKNKEQCLVVLTVCESTELARLLHDEHGFPHVIYSAGRLPVNEGAQFCERFYAQLAVGLGWREAFWETQKGMPLRPNGANEPYAGQPYMLAFGVVPSEIAVKDNDDFPPLLDGPLSSGTENYPIGSALSTVLVARYQVVPFVGRDEWLADFETWCLSSSSSSLLTSSRSSPSSSSAQSSLPSLPSPDPDPKTAVSIVYGPGGVGKTRAMVELAHRLRKQGVLAGFIDRGTSVEQLEQILCDQRRMVIVIDYAESWQNLGDMMRTLKKRDDAGPDRLRVILLSRHVGDWLEALKKSDTSVGELLLGARIREVHETFMTPQGVIMTPQEMSASRQGMFDHALQAFGKRLGKPIPVVTSAPLADPMYKRVLMIHMAALATLLRLDFEPTSLLDRILDHEESFMGSKFEEQMAKDRELPNADAYKEQLRQVVCAITLRGGSSSEVSTVRLVNEQLQLGELFVDVPFLLHRLYPGFRMYVAPMEPDVLGEAMVFRVLSAFANPGNYLAKVFTDNSDAALQAAFLLLGRLSAEKGEGEIWGEVLLRQDVPGRALMAFKTILSMTTSNSEDTLKKSPYTRLGIALAQCLEKEGTLEFAFFVHGLTKEDSVALREVRGWAILKMVEHFSTVGSDDDDVHAKHGNALIDHSIHQRELGQREFALGSAKMSLEIFQRLSHSTDRYLPDLARCLDNIATCCHKLDQLADAVAYGEKGLHYSLDLAAVDSEQFLPSVAARYENLGLHQRAMGRFQEARLSVQSAFDLYCELAAARGTDFFPFVAKVLVNLGSVQSEVGQREAALQSLESAVFMYRQLATSRPDEFLPYLAGSFQNLAATQSKVGQRDPALQSAQDAVNIYHQLAAFRPDEFMRDWALSLNNLGSIQSALGQRKAALQSTRKAVDTFRQIVAARGASFSGDLALSLTSLGMMQRDMGQLKEALLSTQDAVDICHQLNTIHPEAFLNQFAYSLNNLGVMQSELGQVFPALRSSELSVKIQRQLADARGDPLSPDLATSLDTLGGRQCEVGQLKEALHSAKEAEAIFRQVSKVHPDAFLPDLASALNNKGKYYSLLGQHNMGLQAALEVVDIRRHLVTFWPEAFLPKLASSLRNLALHQRSLGELDDALANAEESVALFTQLTQRLPVVFSAPFAESLQTLAEVRASRTGHTVATAPGVDFVNLLVSSLNSQGYTSLRNGDWLKAKEFLERALSICEQHYGRDHHTTANVRDSLAEILTAGGELYAAIEHSLHALQTLDRPDAPQTLLACVLTNFGAALYGVDQHEEAHIVIERAITIFETQGVPANDQYYTRARRLRRDLTVIEAARSE